MPDSTYTSGKAKYERNSLRVTASILPTEKPVPAARIAARRDSAPATSSVAAPLDIGYLNRKRTWSASHLNPLFLSDEPHEQIFKTQRHRFDFEQAPSVLHDACGQRRAHFFAVTARVGDEGADAVAAAVHRPAFEPLHEVDGSQRLAHGRRRTRHGDERLIAALQFRRQLFGRVLRDDSSAVDDHDAAAGHIDLGQNVRRQQHGGMPRQRAKQLADFDHLARIESDSRLVENQHFGIAQDGLRDSDALPITLRQFADELAPHVLEAAGLERIFDSIARRLRIDLAHARAEFEQRVDAEVGIQHHIFRQVTDAPAGLERMLRDVEAADHRASRGRREKSREDSHDRRLARAVGAQQPDDLALFDLERNVVYGQRSAEIFG